jgi:hypothetical protein
MTLDVPEGSRGRAAHPLSALGAVPLTVRRRRGAYRLALTARRAVGSNRGRTDDPA